MRISDWSSDVCSSDLIDIIHAQGRIEAREGRSGELRAAVERVLRRVLDTLAAGIAAGEAIDVGIFDIVSREYRIAIFGVVQRISDIEDKAIGQDGRAFELDAFSSEERRVGRECVSTCRSRW